MANYKKFIFVSSTTNVGEGKTYATEAAKWNAEIAPYITAGGKYEKSFIFREETHELSRGSVKFGLSVEDAARITAIETANDQFKAAKQLVAEYTKAGSYSAITATDTIGGAIGKLEAGLNQAQTDISGKVDAATGTTQGNVVVFGADGKTIADSGFTLGVSVPSTAKFTDTLPEETYHYTPSVKDEGATLNIRKTSEDYNKVITEVYLDSRKHVVGVGGTTLGAGDIGLGNVTNDAQVKRTEMGVANGVATLDANGKVPSTQLPSYVDDVLEYANLAAFPAEGETGKIYVTKDTNITYRWSGTQYVIISATIALGETSSTAYAGDKGKANADAIASHTGNTTVHVTSDERTAWNGKYSKPSGGIPKSDLASDVQTSLGKADSAIQDINGNDYVEVAASEENASEFNISLDIQSITTTTGTVPEWNVDGSVKTAKVAPTITTGNAQGVAEASNVAAAIKAYCDAAIAQAKAEIEQEMSEWIEL